jgi:hypothetical protein
MKELIRRARPLWALLLTLLALSIHAAGAQGRNAADILPKEAAAAIAATGRAVRAGSGEPEYLPTHESAAALRAALAAEKPSVLVEAAFELKRPKPASAAAAVGELAAIYGILRSIGSLEGIEYYSASRQSMRTLYAESYIIAAPGSKDRVADPRPPAVGAIPKAETLYAFQRDLSFGSNSYRYDFSAFPDAILLKTENLTRMSYKLVPMVSPNALKTRILVVQVDDAIVFYAESGASAPSVFKGKLEDSFANRAEALFKWFSAKYSGQPN